MRLLFVGPEICSPWSEGRKVFVRDLIETLQHEHELAVLTSIPKGEKTDFPVPHRVYQSSSKAGLLFSIVSNLSTMLESFKPDLVCHFSYGTFRRHYGAVNKYYMRKVDRICAKRAVPCISLMYSLDAFMTPAELAKSVSCLASGRTDKWQQNVIEPGLRSSHWPPKTTRPNVVPRLLFMAGMWQTTRERVDFVLAARGLGLLLEAGRFLQDSRLELIIAAPLFADKTCRDYLLNSSVNGWRTENIRIESTVKVPDIYMQADLFVFPYAGGEKYFKPTSVIEAMSAGTPVVISDLPIFKGLVEHEQSGFIFESGNPEALARAIRSALSDTLKLGEMGKLARKHARERWSIENSAAQLLDLAGKITAKE